jgi:rubrerythrin
MKPTSSEREMTVVETQMLLHELEALAQLDTDAVQVYEDVLQHVTDEDVSKQFRTFQGEHRHHAEALSDAIVRLGGVKPELKVDLIGRMADWVSEFRSMSGTRGALHAMKTAELYHNRRYGEAVTWDVADEEIATMLRRFDDNEKRHLAFVEERLASGSAMAGDSR